MIKTPTEYNAIVKTLTEYNAMVKVGMMQWASSLVGLRAGRLYPDPMVCAHALTNSKLIGYMLLNCCLMLKVFNFLICVSIRIIWIYFLLLSFIYPLILLSSV